MAVGQELHHPNDLIKFVLDELHQSCTPREFAAVQSLLAGLGHLYGAAMERVLGAVRETAQDPKPVLDALAKDEVVSHLLDFHDLQPSPTHEEWDEIVEPTFGDAEGARLRTTSRHILVARLDGQYYAYDDRCPTCHAVIEDVIIVGGALPCLSCEARYELRDAGRSSDGSSARLRQLPLTREHGRLRLSSLQQHQATTP